MRLESGKLSKFICDKTVLRAELSLGGPGPTVMVKDCLDVAGYITGCGSPAFENAACADKHADVVAAVLANGCMITGKTGMHELAFGMTGINPHYGTPINPHWPDLIPGGSSSGSAVVVAAGLCDFAIGTDTGGSVRLPAICCGVYGFKPSFGRVSRRGAIPAESSLDCIGIFAGSPLWLSAGMASLDPSFVPQTLSAAPRLANIEVECDAEIARALDTCLLQSRLTPVPAKLPSLMDAFAAGLTIINAEAYQAFGGLLNNGAALGDDIRQRLRAAAGINADAIREAEIIRARFTSEVDAALNEVDALILPALPVTPPSLSQAKDPHSILPLSRLLRPFNLSGHPALVMPVRTRAGLPAGIQLVGRKGDDAGLCAIATWLVSNSPMFLQEVVKP